MDWRVNLDNGFPIRVAQRIKVAQREVHQER